MNESIKKRPIQKTPVNLGNFILLSLLAHGIVLMTQIQSSQAPDLPYGAQRLNVSLSTINDKASNLMSLTAQNQLATAPEVRSHAAPRLEKNIAKAIVTVNKSVSSLPKQTAKQIFSAHKQKTKYTYSKKTYSRKIITTDELLTSVSLASENKSSRSQHNILLGKIKSRLSRHFNYPSKARRRGWEGEVKIGFNVDSQGYLSNIHLSQTSGYNLLDTAALNAVEKVKNIPPSQWGNTANPVALVLPVIYQLTNS